jgi:predicted nucleic acid-binding Zn ribbon protein
MRGRRRTLAAVLAQSLAGRQEAEPAAIAAAFAEACGARLAREVSFRGVLRDGRLLVLARSAAWATQVESLAPDLCERVNARLGRRVAAGLEVRVSSPEP